MKLPRLLILFASLAGLAPLGAQPEMMQWGSLRGLRVEGQLLSVPLELQVIRADGTVATRTAHYAHSSAYRRAGTAQRVEVKLGGIEGLHVVDDAGAGRARVDVTFTAQEARAGDTGALVLVVGGADYPGARVSWLGTTAPAAELSAVSSPLRQSATGLRVQAGERFVEVSADQPLAIEVVPAAEAGAFHVRFPVLAAPAAGASATRRFTVQAGAPLDRAPVDVALDATRPGRRFEGLGGNFRLQFPASDPAIIDYKLAHLRVTWARIAMWWRDWDAEESADPLAAARAGRVTERIRKQVALAQRLARAGLPVIVSVWDPPAWANLPGPRAAGMYNDAVNPAKWPRMAESIADYLLFLKESAGVEAVLFSFNEPELGLMPTPAEHVAFIKILGEACLARGLATKHLVADTSNATRKSLGFAQAALADPACRPFLGAVGFHSWGGTEDENLVQWDATARRLGLPLLITEAGPDSEAHRHPDLFYEPAYTLDEIELYVRMCGVAQPTSLMHWQLTADYTLLKGGGAYGRDGPLEPTPRFWNYQQLAESPAPSFSLPVRASRRDVSVAAFGDPVSGRCAVHLVNSGAARTAVVTGLPAGLRQLRVLRTPAAGARAPETTVPVQDGRAEVPLVAAGLTSAYGSAEP